MIHMTGRGRGHDKHRSFGTMTREVTNDELRRYAPSVFAETPLPGVSANYSFIPTIRVVDGLRKEGWSPVWVSEQRVRLETRVGFQKHMIRFQRSDHLGKTAEFNPEICLVNSHDRSSAYQVHAGIFRFICGNGMIVADSTFEKVSIRHTKFEPSAVIEASCQVLDNIPKLTQNIETFKARRLSPLEAKAFAESALIIRYEDLKQSPIGPEKLLEARRPEDQDPSLWSTFNRLQENLIRGGVKDISRRKADGSRFARTRGVAGLDQTVSLNKALWHLAEVLRSSAPQS